MRLQLHFRRSKRGYALLITLVFLGIALAFLANLSRWTYTEVGLTHRNNLYNDSVAAAEAATEMVIASMDRDFVAQNVNSDLTVYRNLTPNSIQSPWPVQFRFADSAGSPNVTGVESLGAPTTMTNINSQFAGLYGQVIPYRITSTARTTDQLYDVSATVRQDIQMASIPVFQFAIFYTINLEINPGPLMKITGKVHSNGDIYTAPVAGLEYKDSVTAVGKIFNDRDPNDPQYGSSKVAPVYDKAHMEKVSALSLPVGTDNSPASVQEVLRPPPASENPNSELGRQRYYNKADLIVTVSPAGVTSVKSGLWNNFATVTKDLTNGSGYSFIDTSKTMNDLRETKPVVLTEIDAAKLNSWMLDPTKGAGLNSLANFRMGHPLDSIYVDDQRIPGGKITAVRVVNAATLPGDGLTVATYLPLYVKGNFNLNNGDTTPGQTDTSKTKRASLVGDAITILSQNWDDGNAGKSLVQRPAINTTVNAAFLGGIVATTLQGNKKYYSGGVENFPRFLEDWSGRTLTYNGSMVVMFYSQFARSFWQSPGNYYNAPTRSWAFDVNFLNQNKLPPCTPQVRKLVRGQWTIVPPSS